MSASYPKPDAERRNRVAPAFGWIDLPAEGRKGRAPALPGWRQWSPQTLLWWKTLWTTPQATQWQSDGSTLHTLAVLHDAMIAGAEPTRLSAEMRQHEDRHGLSPKSLLQLRWRITQTEAAEKTAAPRRSDRRAKVVAMRRNG